MAVDGVELKLKLNCIHLGTDGVRVEISANKNLVAVGEDVEVRCDVSGDRNPMIRWTKVHGGLADNVQTFGNLLRVTDIQPANGGVYKCLAITKSGVFEDDYALTIQGKALKIEVPSSGRIFDF